MEIGGISMAGMGFNLDGNSSMGGSGINPDEFLEDLPSLETLVGMQDNVNHKEDETCCDDVSVSANIKTGMSINASMHPGSINTTDVEQT